MQSDSCACPAQAYFSTLSHKQHDIQKKKVIEHKMYVLILSRTSPETFPILRIILHVQSIGYSCQILLKVRFFRQVFEKYTYISNLTKIRPAGAEFVPRGRAVRRTDVTKALRARLKATPSNFLYVGANISKEHTVSSFRVGNHQPEYVTGRDHRVNLRIVH
jgi:hypothetical protein